MTSIGFTNLILILDLLEPQRIRHVQKYELISTAPKLELARFPMVAAERNPSLTYFWWFMVITISIEKYWSHGPVESSWVFPFIVRWIFPVSLRKGLPEGTLTGQTLGVSDAWTQPTVFIFPKWGAMIGATSWVSQPHTNHTNHTY